MIVKKLVRQFLTFYAILFMSVYNHENFIPLDSNTILWRYLDFKKFQSLLKTKSLFFCRADKFSDPFEGSLPKIEADYRINEEKRNAEMLGREFNEEEAWRNISNRQKLHQKLKRATIVNCWHINNNESDAMWRLYLKDNEGVAIQTTKEKIYKVIENTFEKIGLSKVRYLNYEIERWYHPIDYPHKYYNLYIPLIHKRIEFKHENEFRLLLDIEDAINDDDYWEKQPDRMGKHILIDVKLLIDKIYLPPTVDAKTVSRMEQMSKNLGYEFQFEKSSLTNEPLY